LAEQVISNGGGNMAPGTVSRATGRRVRIRSTLFGNQEVGTDMSDRIQSPVEPGSAPRQRAPKPDRRAEAKAAAAKAAAAQARRDQLIGALAGFAVVAVLVGVFVVLNGRDSDSTAATPDSAATATAGPEAPAGDFPQLPEGADPALGSRPTVTAGDGELTKLTVTPLVEGTGPAVEVGKFVTVNYVGVNYATGEEFDASWNRSEPFSFTIGVNGVIQGWDQGLIGVKVGSRVQLDIPTEMAYPQQTSGPTSGPLRFVVDVLAVD
jgi:peptidylprolyl isomerase